MVVVVLIIAQVGIGLAIGIVRTVISLRKTKEG